MRLWLERAVVETFHTAEAERFQIDPSQTVALAQTVEAYPIVGTETYWTDVDQAVGLSRIVEAYQVVPDHAETYCTGPALNEEKRTGLFSWVNGYGLTERLC